MKTRNWLKSKMFCLMASIFLMTVVQALASSDQELLSFLRLNSNDPSIRENVLDLKVSNNIRFRDIAQAQYDLWKAIQDNKNSLIYVDATAMFKAIDEVVEEVGSELIGWATGQVVFNYGSKAVIEVWKIKEVVDKMDCGLACKVPLLLVEILSRDLDKAFLNQQIGFYLFQVGGYNKKDFTIARPFEKREHEDIWSPYPEKINDDGYLRVYGLDREYGLVYQRPLSNDNRITPALVKNLCAQAWKLAYANYLLQSDMAELRERILRSLFIPGDRVRTTTNLNLRRIPGVITDSNRIATLDLKARGVVLADSGNGQLYNTANRWWLVEFPAYGRGWVAGAFLAPDTSADLVVESIRLVPSQPSPKKEVEIIFKVINYGPAHIKEAYLGFYFDDKPAEYFRGSLDAGSSQEYKQQLSWPDDLLNHKIVVIASYVDAMPDLDFTNNTLLLNISAVANAPEPSSDILPSLGGDPPETNGPVTNNPNPNPPPSVANPPVVFVKLEPLTISLTPAEPEKLVPAELGGRINGRGTYDSIPFPDWFYNHSEGDGIHLRVTDYSQVKISQTFIFFVVSGDTMRYRDLKVSVVSSTDWEKQLEDARYLDVPKEYQTIAAALEKVESGQTIRIAAGEYQVSNLNLKDNITLEGNNSTLNLSSGEGYVLRTEAQGVRLSNLTLKGIGKDRVRTYGLYLEDGAEVVLDNVSFLDFYHGIDSQARPSSGQGTSLSIRNSRFKDCYQGISSLGGTTLEVKDSQFLNNQHIGLYIYFPKSLLLENTSVSGSQEAIRIQDCRKEPAVLKNLTIQNNREGIYLEQSWAEISNSNVSENQFTGIMVRGRARITNTSLKNNGSGLYLGFSSTDMDRETKEVGHCQIIGNKEIGIQIYHQGSDQTRVSIDNSDIFNNQENLNLIDQLKTCSVDLTDIFFNTLDEQAIRQTITVPDDRRLNLTNIRQTGAVDSSLIALPVQEPEPEVVVAKIEDQSLSLETVRDYVTIPYSPSFDLRDQLIIEAWVKRKSNDPRSVIVTRGAYGLWIDPVSRPSLQMVVGRGDFNVIEAQKGGVPQNQWTHIAATYDGEIAKLYTNGELVGSVPVRGLIYTNDNPVTIGQWPGGGYSFQGELDEIRIWNISRTEEELKASMKTSLVGTESGLIAYWNFDDGTVNDLSPNKNNGVIKGEALVIKKETISASPLLGEFPGVDQTLLLQNYPNPSNPETWIPYQLKEESRVTLLIHDIRGILIRRIDLGLKERGFYLTKDKAIHWDGRNNFGESVASGIYFYTIITSRYKQTKKMVVGR